MESICIYGFVQLAVPFLWKIGSYWGDRGDVWLIIKTSIEVFRPKLWALLCETDGFSVSRLFVVG
jgi:hypothetical protein